MEPSVHIFGIRHHGPGSARSLLKALFDLRPDILLLEGPADSQVEPLLSLASKETMSPPVALLLYVPDKPRNAVFYPFARFSPEWNAIKYSQQNEIPVRFIDLPQSYQLAIEARAADAKESEYTDDSPDDDDDQRLLRQDPLGALARSAGFTDGERWWESLVEHRRDTNDVFAAILTAMTTVREQITHPIDILDELREAFMRQSIRKAKRDGYQNIAVVCGAWHAPAIMSLGPAKSDLALLDNLPKVKIAATWVPWTNRRLSFTSGYGAGIESPGWYAHLWDNDKQISVRWMTLVSRLLRENDIDSSPAQVIDAVRLAETLASLRGQSIPTLREMTESAQTVFSFGSNLQLKLIQERLIVGDVLGTVPQESPTVPLQSDIETYQRKLRLSPEAVQKALDLDLRKDNDLARSHLLHRLNLLGINWGKREAAQNVKGTFHEIWRLQWLPEFPIAIIESSIWGNTVSDATDAAVRHTADKSQDLPTLSRLLNSALLADLPDTSAYVMTKVNAAAAVSSDIGELMDSLPALVNIQRYGDVRKTDAELVLGLITSIAARITIGLPTACAKLDDDAAQVMFKRIRDIHMSLSLVQDTELLDSWMDSIDVISESETVHGLIAGRAARLLLDSGRLNSARVVVALKLAIAQNSDPTHGANWLEGLLHGSGQLLIVDDELRHSVDLWISDMTDEVFATVLPLIRRTLSTFESPERRSIGERIKAGSEPDHDDGASLQHFNVERAEAALPLVLRLLGLSLEEVKSNG